jgi:hypothetical protein
MIGQGFQAVTPSRRKNTGDHGVVKVDADGSIAFYIQNESPRTAMEANWLHARMIKCIPLLLLYRPKMDMPSF